MEVDTDPPSAQGAEADRPSSLRRNLEFTWVVGVVLFTLARFGAAWGALADHDRWVVWAFGVIDIVTAVPYAVGTARLVTSLIDRRPQAAARWGIVASASFLAPYLWLAWVGRDGSLPTVVYIAMVVCLVSFGANAILSVRRKVREARVAGPPVPPDDVQGETPDPAPTPVRAPG